MNNKCDIIKDLLPSYAYNLTSCETNKFIEEHLVECKKCKEVLNNIENEEKIVEENKTRKYIDFAKKYNNKVYFFKLSIFFIIMIMLAIILVPIIQKICILSNLSDKANKYESVSNVHIVKYSYDETSYVKNEFWQLENCKKIERTSLENKNVTNIQIYANKNQDYYLINSYVDENGEKKVYSDIRNEFVGFYIDNVFAKENYFEFLKSAIFSTVKKTTFDGKECYYILNFNRENGVLSNGVYVDIETGLVINEITHTYENEKTYPATTYIYDFGSVTKDNFIEPDINDYKRVENN